MTGTVANYAESLWSADRSECGRVAAIFVRVNTNSEFWSGVGQPRGSSVVGVRRQGGLVWRPSGPPVAPRALPMDG